MSKPDTIVAGWDAPIIRQYLSTIEELTRTERGDMADQVFESEMKEGKSEQSALGRGEGGTVQNIPDLPSQGFGREWLLQEGNAGVQDAMVDDGVVRIARDVQHLHFWTHFDQAFGEFASAHLLQHDIGKQQIDFPGMALAH
jgi:hypothetical protein